MSNDKTIEMPIFCQLLTVLFIGLKLTHQINWNWWVVLSPIIIPIAVGIAFIAICFTSWFILTVLKKLLK